MFLFVLCCIFICSGNSESLLSTFKRYKSELYNTVNTIAGKEIIHVEPLRTCPADASHQLEFGRYAVIYCLHYLADKNCDHAIDAEELTYFKNNQLNIIERSFFSLKTNIATIMEHCDKNGDGKITDYEFIHDYDGCLNNVDELCRARDICYREITNTKTPLCKN